jgi:peptidoglycan hydrolase-like protein with peptidoglycan-binding domain
MSRWFFKICLPVLVVMVFFPIPTKASSTNGSIDSTNNFAWSENMGWINFGCDHCDVSVSDSAVTGHAWSANYGWINLNPAQSGVTNNGEGTLGGSAWGENTGWIDFSGVTIDSSGVFSGYASGGTTGQISFNCANTGSCNVSDFKLSTDWRPQSVRPACNNSLDDDSDGEIDFGQDDGCDSASDNDETDGGGGGVPIPRSVGEGDRDFAIGIDEHKGGYTIDEDGANFLVYVGSKVGFSIKDSPFRLNTAKISGLDVPSGEIFIEISSKDEIFVSLFPGDEKAVDVNNDGIADLKIEYNALKINRADLTFSDTTQNKKPNGESGSRVGYVDGDLLKTKNDPTVYLLEDGKLRPILNGQIFERRGFAWSNIKVVNNLNDYSIGDVLGYDDGVLSDGDLVKTTDHPRVYLLEDGKKRPIENEKAFNERGFDWSNIIEVNDLSVYPDGGLIQALDDSVADDSHRFENDLKVGDRGDDVRRLQRFLNNRGFNVAVSGPGSSGNETEIFGNLTREALVDFQNHYSDEVLEPVGLNEGTGYFGSSTRRFVNSLLRQDGSSEEGVDSAVDAAQESADAHENAWVFADNVTKGAENENVSKLQGFLARDSEVYPEGVVSGYFGNLTQRAVERFQLKHGVVESENAPGFGILGPQTRSAINALID